MCSRDVNWMLTRFDHLLPRARAGFGSRRRRVATSRDGSSRRRENSQLSRFRPAETYVDSGREEGSGRALTAFPRTAPPSRLNRLAASQPSELRRRRGHRQPHLSQ